MGGEVPSGLVMESCLRGGLRSSSNGNTFEDIQAMGRAWAKSLYH